MVCGEYFEEGNGRDIDIEQALFWYRKAAAKETNVQWMLLKI
jgi:TPR repeat protein